MANYVSVMTKTGSGNFELMDREARQKKVNIPLDANGYPTNGEDGQCLRTKGNGATEWANIGLPTDEQTSQAVNNWLNLHPEATTTVVDGSLTYSKLVNGTMGYVTPEMFGAVGNGIEDDTEAVAEAIAFNGGDIIVLFTKQYLSDAISLKSGNKLIFKDGSELIQKGGNDVESYIFIKAESCQNVVIDGATIVGNYGNYEHGDFDEYADLLNIRKGSKNIRVSNCIFKNSVGDGLEVCAGSLNSYDISENVVISNCQFENIGCCDFAITGGKNIVLRDSILSGGKRILPKCAIDLEPNDEAVGNDNVLISGIVHSGDTGTQGIFINPWSNNITLDNVITNKEIIVGNTQAFTTKKAQNVTIKNCKMDRFVALNADNCVFESNTIRGKADFEYSTGSRFSNNDISNDSNHTLVLANLIDCIIDGNYIHGTPSAYAIECSNGTIKATRYSLDKYFFVVSNNIIVNNTSYAIEADAGVMFINNVFTNQKLNRYYFSSDRINRTCRVIDTINTNIRSTDWNLIKSYFKRGDSLISSNPTSGHVFMYYCKTEGYYSWASWEASTSVTVVDSIKANGYVYVCVTAGTTGSTQPSFTTNVDDIISDGTAEWKCMGTVAEFGTVKFE